jgi:hypothetical protein
MCEDTGISGDQTDALKKLMAPFDESQISKLPKGTQAQNKCPPEEKRSCKICGGWHHPKIAHLDYVGHADITKRLLEVDPFWNWEPFAVDEVGSPKLDKDGGMWIWLTVCGMKRRGYGDAGGKTGTDANKERIGDAIRNAAMRFGAAIDLWSKADKVRGSEPEPEKHHYFSKDVQQASRKAVEQWLKYIDDHITIEGPGAAVGLEAGWEQNLKPILHKFPADQQNELNIAYKSTLQLLNERKGDIK